MAGEAQIVAIGPEREMAGLTSVGIDVVPVESGDELAEALTRRAEDPSVCVILISERVAEGARELVAALRQTTDAVLLLVPSHTGSRATAVQWIKHGMEQSIGVDMISGD